MADQAALMEEEKHKMLKEIEAALARVDEPSKRIG